MTWSVEQKASLLVWSLLAGGVAAAHYDAARGLESAKLYGGFHAYGYYFLDLLIGSERPQRTSAIVDTGSSLIGFPCTGCEHCSHRHLDLAFNISQSGSAEWLGCSQQCEAWTCQEGRCAYSQGYSEGSEISGFWFEDFVEFGDSFQPQLPVRTRLGCHMKESDMFYDQLPNGIMGLAPTDEGRQAQVLRDLFRDKEHLDAEVFSICLATWGGALTLGGYNASYHLSEITWIDLVPSVYYYVEPQGLWLGDLPVSLGPGSLGDTIVDSGTTMTLFPPAVHSTLLTDMGTYCQTHGGCGATQDGEGCWRLNDPKAGPGQFPPIVFDFGSGQRMAWPASSYLYAQGFPLEQDVWCPSFDVSDDNTLVLGMSWMMHRDVIFDLGLGRLGVAAASCPEHYRALDTDRSKDLKNHQRSRAHKQRHAGNHSHTAASKAGAGDGTPSKAGVASVTSLQLLEAHMEPSGMLAQSRWWPVPLVAGIGLASFSLGWRLSRFRATSAVDVCHRCRSDDVRPLSGAIGTADTEGIGLLSA